MMTEVTTTHKVNFVQEATSVVVPMSAAESKELEEAIQVVERWRNTARKHPELQGFNFEADVTDYRFEVWPTMVKITVDAARSEPWTPGISL